MIVVADRDWMPTRDRLDAQMGFDGGVRCEYGRPLARVPVLIAK